MLKSQRLLFTFAVFGLAPLMAQGQDFVSAPQLTLFGRSIESEALQSQLALTCHTEDCTQLRFALFYRDADTGCHVGEYIGPTIQVMKAKSDRLQKKAFRLAMDDFFFDHQTESSLKSLKRKSALIYIIPLAGAATISAVNPTTIGFLIAGSSLAPAYYTSIGLTSVSFFRKNRRTSATLSDKEGWNWSVDPKSVSKEKFLTFLGQIEHGKNALKLDDTDSKIIQKVGQLLKSRHDRLNQRLKKETK